MTFALRTAAAVLLAASLVAPAAGAIDDDPGGLIRSSTSLAKVRALYARTHAAERTRAATVIELWRLAQDNMTGTFRVRRLGKDVRETTTLGPLTYEQGIHAGLRWQQNRNGITYTFSGFHDQRDAISERAWDNANDTHDVRLVGESVPLDAYVVEINPTGGRHEWLFIDKRTGNVIRRERMERRRRVIITYDEFRTFDGIPEPSRVRQTDSFGNEREQTLLSRTLDLTPDLVDVAIPPTRRTFVEFPAGTPLVRLPIRFINGLMIVHVTIGFHGYDFILDSGAAGIVVDPSVVDDQHLERYGTRIGATIGTFSEATTIVPQISTGVLKMHNVVARVLGVPFRVDDRTRIAGLLGFDFFADAIVHVDEERFIVEAIAPSAFKPPQDAVATTIALDDKTPAIRARVGSAIARIILDTGANRSVFTTAYSDRADFAVDPTSVASRFRGVGGIGTAESAHLKQFEFAGIPVTDPSVDVSSADLGVEDIDGTAGTDMLRNYDLFFDYRANTVYARRPKAVR